MMHLVQKFGRFGDVMMEFCAATCFTAKECMLPDRHRKAVVCDVKSKLLTAPVADLVLTSVF